MIPIPESVRIGSSSQGRCSGRESRLNSIQFASRSSFRFRSREICAFPIRLTRIRSTEIGSRSCLCVVIFPSRHEFDRGPEKYHFEIEYDVCHDLNLLAVFRGRFDTVRNVAATSKLSQVGASAEVQVTYFKLPHDTLKILIQRYCSCYFRRY